MRTRWRTTLALLLLGAALAVVSTLGPPVVWSQIGGGPTSGVYPPFLAGNGTGAFKPGGTLYWEYTNTANAADTLYVTSTVYTLPANTLATNGDRLDIYVTAVYDGTAATKTTICNIGYSAFDTTSGFTGGVSFISNATTTVSASSVYKAEVTRLTSTTDLHNFWAATSTANQVSGVAAGSVTWANANNILCSAKSSVGTGGIVTLRDMRVTWNPR